MLYHGHESSSDSVEAYRPHPPMLYRNPGGSPLTVATHQGWELLCGACFGGMFHPPFDESARETGSTPIAGQPSNSFQDSLPFRSPFAFFSFKKYTR